jgi:tetratricopeptide (TPR) repeat protein
MPPSPGFLDQQLQAALALQRRGALAEARRVCEQILRQAPQHVDALHMLGLLAAQAGDPAQAVPLLRKAIKLDPTAAAAYNNLGAALSALGRFREAVASFDKVTALLPNYAGGHCNRANALRSLGRAVEALAGYERAITLKPGYAEAHNGLGNALCDLGRPGDALAHYQQAIALNPGYQEACYNTGNALRALDRHGEALAHFERAVALRPDHAEAHENLGILLLLHGRLGQGWQHYEWRNRTPTAAGSRAFPQPLWTGAEDLAGKTIFLHWEQGLGDTIQFCRYAPLVAARGARVVMAVQDPLAAFLKQLEPAIEVIGNSQHSPPVFDCHAPLMSLPLAFATTLETIPASPRYLAAGRDAVARWADRLPPGPKPRVGLVWSGSTKHQNDSRRSMTLDQLAPLLDADVHWICLQKEFRRGETETLDRRGNIAIPGAALTDFAETAAVIDHLDLVISVDTSVAHLAGAMGKPVWILLPFTPDWRWLLDRSDSPWYPSARLFRQPRPGDWASVVAAARAALDAAFGGAR